MLPQRLVTFRVPTHHRTTEVLVAVRREEIFTIDIYEVHLPKNNEGRGAVGGIIRNLLCRVYEMAERNSLWFTRL